MKTKIYLNGELYAKVEQGHVESYIDELDLTLDGELEVSEWLEDSVQLTLTMDDE